MISYIKECLFVCSKTFFKCEITTIIVGNFETILSVNVTREKRILGGTEFRVSKMIYKDICIKVHGFEVGASYVRQCHSAS